MSSPVHKFYVQIPVEDEDAFDEVLNHLDNLGDRVSYDVLTPEDQARQETSES